MSIAPSASPPIARRSRRARAASTPRPDVAHRAEQRGDLVLGARTCRVPARRARRDGRPCARSRSRARRRVNASRTIARIASRSSAVASLVRALAHHVRAHRRVRHVRPDVDRARHALERVEVLGERLPVPVDPLGERGAGDVLDAFHQLDEPLVAVRAHRREADAAVAEDRGGHAVPARRREVRVPGGLAVEVRVHVDEAGRDEQPVGVDGRAGRARRPGRPRRSRRRRPRRRPCARRRAGAVDDGPASDHEIVHGVILVRFRAGRIRAHPCTSGRAARTCVSAERSGATPPRVGGPRGRCRARRVGRARHPRCHRR